jgi:hypothetical protein
MEHSLFDKYPWDIPVFYDSGISHILGYARDGTIVVLNLLRHLDKRKGTYTEHLNFNLLWNEYTSRKSQTHDRCYVIMDSRGLGWDNADIDRFTTNQPKIGPWVPDILTKVFVLNCGWVVKALYSAIKGFLPERTTSKVCIMGSDVEENKKAIEEVIDLAIVPKDLGGSAENFN